MGGRRLVILNQNYRDSLTFAALWLAIGPLFYDAIVRGNKVLIFVDAVVMIILGIFMVLLFVEGIKEAFGY